MKRILVILAMLVAMNASAQWVQMSNGMGNDKSVTCFAENGNYIFAGLEFGGVYISTNNGTNWNLTLFERIFSIAILGNNIVAGTWPNGVFYSSNNGTNWIQSSLNNVSVNSLVVCGSNLFAGTLDSGVYISTNNGVNWARTSLNNLDVNTLAIFGNNIYAGTELDGIFLSTNNGTNWTKIVNFNFVRSIAVSGNIIYAGLANGLKYSTNSGVNWNGTSLNNVPVYSILINGVNVFAGLGDYGGVYLSTNNGMNWIPKNDGFQGFNILTLFTNSIYIFAGVYDFSVWRRPLSEIIGIQNISTETPSKYSLSQNYPNPFNSTSNLKFQIVNTGDVKLVVYDIQGREVQTLVNERLQPGTYEATFDGSALNTGVYFYKLVTGNFTETKKMLLIK